MLPIYSLLYLEAISLATDYNRCYWICATPSASHPPLLLITLNWRISGLENDIWNSRSCMNTKLKNQLGHNNEELEACSIGGARGQRNCLPMLPYSGFAVECIWVKIHF